MGLADFLGIGDLHWRKVGSNKWLKHQPGAKLGGQEFEKNDGRTWFSFPLGFSGGRVEIVPPAFGDSPKLSSTGLAIQ